MKKEEKSHGENDMKKDEKRRKVVTQVSAELYRILETLAKEEETSISSIVRRAIKLYIKRVNERAENQKQR